MSNKIRNIEQAIKQLESQGASTDAIRVYETLSMILAESGGIGAPSQGLITKRSGVGLTSFRRCIELLARHEYVYHTRMSRSAIKDLVSPNLPGADPNHTGGILYRLLVPPTLLFDASDEMLE